MGEVFEAVHEQIKRRAAIKILNHMYSRDAEMTQRFFNEALAVNMIQPPSTVGVFESGRLPDGRAFIVMEYLDGQPQATDADRLAVCVRGLADRATDLFALATGHEKGTIHRDLKPEVRPQVGGEVLQRPTTKPQQLTWRLRP